MDAVKIVNKINKEHGTIKNVYFLACGGSLVDLYPGYYFVRAESAVMDAQWIPAREFALTPPKKLGKDSLLIICSTVARQRSVWRQQKQEWMQVRLLLQ